MVSRPEGSLAEVAVNAPLDRLFHYTVPEPLRGQLERGHRVLVPFGPRTVAGVCVGFPEEAQVEKLKPIRSILQPDCRFDAHLLELTQWIARYYHASWGEVLEAALPPAIRSVKPRRTRAFVKAASDATRLQAAARERAARAPAQARALEHLATSPGPHPVATLCRELRTTRDALRRLASLGLVELFQEKVEEERPDLEAVTGGDAHAATAAQVPIELHAAQAEALAVVLDAIEGRLGSPPTPILLHGVTGSGKTEVYLRALHRVIRDGGRGLVLVPEISLTPQTVRRFRDSLGGVPIAVLHSMLTPKDRAAQWREIQSGRVNLVIGARSAIFSPIPDLRLIVVDEEHESSYKQESSPRYNARDMAILRARLLGVPVVLGSATPSVESYHNARTGKYHLVELPYRATQHDLPAVHIVELDENFYRPDGSGLISGPLDFRLRECLKRGEQAILFLNRRGFSTYLHCLQCGHVMQCEHCDISLTYHRGDNALRCHYCDRRYTLPRDCPECQFPRLRRSGVGTEKIADVLGRKYPGARVERLDRDTVKNHRSLRSTLASFAAGDIDLLVGTQMLAKGHDFPGVSVVGIISADTGLHFPDFRSAERTFQLITQVSGRAGRGATSGTVILQTFFGEHPALKLAVKSDYAGLYDIEVEQRQALGYPPFGRLAKILVQHDKADRGEAAAEAVAERLRAAARGREGTEVLGPVPSPIARIQEKHRFQILVKSRRASDLLAVLQSGAMRADRRLGGEVVIDVDPQTML